MGEGDYSEFNLANYQSFSKISFHQPFFQKYFGKLRVLFYFMVCRLFFEWLNFTISHRLIAHLRSQFNHAFSQLFFILGFKSIKFFQTKPKIKLFLFPPLQIFGYTPAQNRSCSITGKMMVFVCS